MEQPEKQEIVEIIVKIVSLILMVKVSLVEPRRVRADVTWTVLHCQTLLLNNLVLTRLVLVQHQSLAQIPPQHLELVEEVVQETVSLWVQHIQEQLQQ